MRRLLNWRILLVVLVIVGIFASLRYPPIEEFLEQKLTQFVGQVEELGFWGAVVYGAVYILGTLFFLPGSVLTAGAGLAFGLLFGTVLVSISSVLAVSLAFLFSRTVARRLVEKRIKDSPRFQALDEAVGSQGFKIVLLTRLSPVFPYNLLNYVYGLTQVRFWDYFFASWIGMLPGTILYVYIGSTLKKLADLTNLEGEGNLFSKILFFAGLIIAVGVTVFVTRIARRALAQTAPEVLAAGDKPSSESPSESYPIEPSREPETNSPPTSAEDQS